MNVISTTKDLCSFLSSFPASPGFVAIDTEFMRAKTYWPQVCLIQVAAGGQEAAIDPLASGIDLAPLWDFFARPDVLKVFHAARQDLEGFFHLTGKIFAPFFDTQVAAMACAMGDNISYENLVSTLLDQAIDKSERVIDWSRRPLTDKQIRYALDDVIYLRALYPIVAKRLKEWGRESWVAEEMAVLRDPHTYLPDPQKAWKKVKGWAYIPGLTQKSFWLLQKLAAWREEVSCATNIPRRWCLKDESLCDIVTLSQKDPALLSKHLLSEEVRSVMEALIQESATLSSDNFPSLPYKPKVSVHEQGLYNSLSQLLKDSATKAALAPRLIATREDLEELIRFHREGPVRLRENYLLQGWRYDVFGADALKILENSDSP